MIKKIIFLLCFIVLSVGSFAQQTKEELSRKKQELLQEIKDLNASLKNIRNKKNVTLANYNLIKRKIAAREELIQNISKDMHILDNTIYINQLEISRLNRQMDTLKREYAKSLVFAYKNRSNYDYLNFIFSASTFNDAIKRITYLKSYRQYREKQVENINKTDQLIKVKNASLQQNRQEKSMALQDQNSQLSDLEVDKKEQNEEVVKLKTQEKDLSNEIRKRESDRKQMESAIAAIIRRELAEARKKAEALAKQRKAEEEDRKRKLADQRKEAIANKKPFKPDEPEPVNPDRIRKRDRPASDLEMTDEGRRMSINFETGRGNLPWPANGVISIHFGTYTIPGTKLIGRSDGIYITTDAGASVKSVADGEVSSVYDLGGEQAVTVKHGKYFTTYSHLASVNVNQGQQVNATTTIGKAAVNSDSGDGEVLFMVINDRSIFLNPEQWLRRR